MAFLHIDRKKCIQDGICVSVCPSRVIHMRPEDDYPSAKREFEEFCLKCGHCVAVCPSGAFSLDWLSPEQCEGIEDILNITPEQAWQFLCKRRSIRRFKKNAVPRSVIFNLLEGACLAPSAKNRQLWQWVVVENHSEVQRLANLVIRWMKKVIRENPKLAKERGFERAVTLWMEGNDIICRGAPDIIVVHGQNDWGYGPEDCALALSQLSLYATSMGLGSCWGGYFFKAVNSYLPLFKALDLPEGNRVFGAMMVGYPKFEYSRIPVRNKPRVNWL